jgi:threonine/homoserine/homoserine lactone efflux protein
MIDLAAIGPRPLGYVELVAVTLVILTIVDGGYVLMAARVRRLCTSRRKMVALNRGAAALMAGAAATVATS